MEIVRNMDNQKHNKKYKVAICGHFGGTKEFFDGQTVKTKSLACGLKKEYGEKRIQCIDTYGGIKKAPIYIMELLACLSRSNNIVIMPAQNGIKILAPILYYANKLFKRKLHYVVIGGWLINLLGKNIFLKKILKKFDFIYVETRTMKIKLEKIGFDNVLLLPNFKELAINDVNRINYNYREPYSVCTFSRVMKEKGIEDIAYAINIVNKKLNREVFRLDIYGKIDENYKKSFKLLLQKYSESVSYKGVVSPNKSVETLKGYFFLAFPTHFFTEGIPGTIIDAYAAGIPVVSSKWESFNDIIHDRITGIGYSLGCVDELISVLIDIASNPKIIIDMKLKCISEAEKYTPAVAIEILKENL